jgi:hypothetical protein
MDSALQAILEQLEELRKNISAGQDILAVCQEELRSLQASAKTKWLPAKRSKNQNKLHEGCLEQIHGNSNRR